MTRGARNIHGLAAALRRVEDTVGRTGPCAIHLRSDAVGWVSGWSGVPQPACAYCIAYGALHGYTTRRWGSDGEGT